MTARRQSGVTLIELLVTLSIAVILMTIAVPGFQDFLRRNRLESAASNFLATLNYARSEAIRRGVAVSICKSSNGTQCGAGEWEDGWIVFTDRSNYGVINTEGENPEEIIRVHQGLPSGVELNASGNFESRITYKPDGRITNSVGGSFFLCQRGSTVDARRIVVIGTGRARIEAATSCS